MLIIATLRYTISLWILGHFSHLTFWDEQQRPPRKVHLRIKFSNDKSSIHLYFFLVTQKIPGAQMNLTFSFFTSVFCFKDFLKHFRKIFVFISSLSHCNTPQKHQFDHLCMFFLPLLCKIKHRLTCPSNYLIIHLIASSFHCTQCHHCFQDIANKPLIISIASSLFFSFVR